MREIQNENQGVLRVSLKYTEKGKKVISGLKRIKQTRFKNICILKMNFKSIKMAFRNSINFNSKRSYDR